MLKAILLCALSIVNKVVLRAGEPHRIQNHFQEGPALVLLVNSVVVVVECFASGKNLDHRRRYQ